MNPLLWKFNRLRTMGLSEIGYRIHQVVHGRLEQFGIIRAIPGEPVGDVGKFWTEASPRDFVQKAYLTTADRILSGRFDVFSLRDCKLGFPPAWNRDPKSGTEAELAFGKSLNYRDERLVGDIKYLWEPNRHLELVTLAQAFHLSGDARYAGGIRILLDSWFEQCPYLLGPNWTSSLEHAVRLTNWATTWHLLGGEDSQLFNGDDGVVFRRRWLDSVYTHCHFIVGHLSRYSSANNHLLGEYIGLLFGAMTWPCWDESDGWRGKELQSFEAEVLKQNAPDGVHQVQRIWLARWDVRSHIRHREGLTV